MNSIKTLIAAVTFSVLASAPTTLLAVEKKDAKDAKTEAKEAKSAYPLEICVVAEEKLGDMGKPFVFKHEGREVKLCCKGCKKDFDKNPKKFLTKLDEAEKKAKAKKGAKAEKKPI